MSRLVTVGGVALALLLASLGACSKGPEPKFPPRPEGCEVRVFQNAPNVPTENIGPVRARCGDAVTDQECLRTLQDVACKLGADVLWGVGDPEIRDGIKYLTGRAAHTTEPSDEGEAPR